MYTVRVADNFHYRDESETTTLGEFATFAEAEAAARAVVDRFLADQHAPGMTADALYRHYQAFGDEPYIVASPGVSPPRFSGWEYARMRCGQLCGETPDTGR